MKAMLDRLCRVVEWLCFGVWVTTLYSIIGYIIIDMNTPQENKLTVLQAFMPVYFNLNKEFIYFLVAVSYTLMYVVRGKVRLLPWK